MTVEYRHLSKAELDVQLSPSKSAKDPWGVLARHEKVTAALAARPDLRLSSDLAYGPGERQRIDVVRPDVDRVVPCLVFLHGGFWQEGSKAGSGFAAAELASLGLAHASVGYTLAPEASLSEIVAEVAVALTTLGAEAAELGIDPDRLIVAGHSAGAHLAAAIIAGAGGAEVAAMVAAGVLISGVYDLAPIAASYVNEAVGMTAQEVTELSPLFLEPCRDVPIHLLVGGDEPEAFQVQTNALYTSWQSKLSQITIDRVAGRDHFDVLDELSDPISTARRFIVDAVRG